MQNRTFGPYLAAINRIIISLMMTEVKANAVDPTRHPQHRTLGTFITEMNRIH
jgi:hypothetical protein